MARTISLSFPHDLTEDEVKKRLDTGLADARAKFGGQLSGVKETWNGNRLDFTAKALGQTITGRIDIDPKVLHVNVDLPFFLAMLANKVMPQIETETRKMLDKK